MPKWRRVRLGDRAADAASEAAWTIPTPDVSSVDDLAALLLVVVGAVVFAVVLIPLLLFGIELIIVVFLVAAGILGRSLLGRPWVVRAIPASDHESTLAWRVTGLRRSTRLIDEVAASLAAGRAPVLAEEAEALLTAAPCSTSRT